MAAAVEGMILSSLRHKGPLGPLDPLGPLGPSEAEAGLEGVRRSEPHCRLDYLRRGHRAGLGWLLASRFSDDR